MIKESIREKSRFVAHFFGRRIFFIYLIVFNFIVATVGKYHIFSVVGCNIDFLLVMIVNDSSVCRNIHGVTDYEIEIIKAYLLGAVHIWCRDRHGEWFSAKDLVGGANNYWEKTPLYALYEHYLKMGGGDTNYAFSQAGIAVGRLLKIVLANDEKRQYETEVRYTRVYRWVDEELLY